MSARKPLDACGKGTKTYTYKDGKLVSAPKSDFGKWLDKVMDARLKGLRK